MKNTKQVLLLLLVLLWGASSYAVELKTKADYERNALGLFAGKNDIAAVLKKAKQGDARAQYYQGVIDSGGRSFIIIPTKAGITWFRKAAKQGYIDAYVVLAKAYKEGKGVEKSKKLSNTWYQKALNAYQELAQQGDKESQFKLAEFYARGLGVEKDQKKAFAWLQKSADQRYPEASLAMARFHTGSFGMVKYDPDLEEKKIFSLGMRFYSQVGGSYSSIAQEEAQEVKQEVQKAMTEAQAFYKQNQLDKASDALGTAIVFRRYIPAYYMQAVIYLNGYMPVDKKNTEERILYYLTLPAEAGMPQAQFELAKLYLKKRDADNATKWFYKVGEAGLKARNKQAIVGAVQGLKAVAQQLRSDMAAGMAKELKQRAKRL